MKKLLIICSVSCLLIIAGCEKPEVSYITNVHIIDVETGEIAENRYIEMTGGVITQIADAAALPADAETVFDGESMYLTPGLSDMQVYCGKKIADIEFWGTHPGDTYLSYGITNLRNGATNYFPASFAEAEAEMRGNETPGPDFIWCLPANYSTGKYAESIGRDMEAAEAEYVKINFYVAPAQMDNILNYTEENNIYTKAAVYNIGDFNRCAGLGLDELESIAVIDLLLMPQDFAESIEYFKEEEYYLKYDEFFSSYYGLSDTELLQEFGPQLENIIAKMKSKNIAITTGMFIEEISSLKIDNPDAYVEYAVEHRLPEFIDNIKIMTRRVSGDHFRLETVPDYIVFRNRLNKLVLQLLHDADILVAAGTDWNARSWYGIAPGLSLHDELRILTENGFTNLEALQTATLNASIIGERMKTKRKWGLIKEGFSADFILTEDNPLNDLSVLRDPFTVIKAGAYFTHK
ncbi:MAG: amidohydrolase family protein [Spirochaetales bacterium]|uniref:Amidohydrolase family protein n=1 Tax=Candidatus Thalassospirochaeta sargassi TaxID=3119039 RepID=A0AAJ1MKZ5_9SPIO|nr:amidohydrolase family protein [Spirochaetales bacterium]